MNTPKLSQIIHDHHSILQRYTSLLIACIFIFTSSIFLGIPLLLIGTIKVFTNNQFADSVVINIAKKWISINNKLIDNILPNREWNINFPGNLDPTKKYLLICNHQSWADTSIIQYISHGENFKPGLPLTRFFTKSELLYLPFVGQAFYFLDFPMMKRYSKEAIKKDPSLKGQDILEAKRACEQLKLKPFTLLNYLEGTRFTSIKHAHQNSPYNHLLKPKAGGLCLAISALGDEIDGILDMTIVYPQFKEIAPSYADLWQGNIQKLEVDIHYINIPDNLYNRIKNNGYNSDKQTRNEIFAWLDSVWQDKDKRIDNILNSFDT